MIEVPPGHPMPGHPPPEEVEKVMEEFDWGYLKALQYLLIEADNPDGTDAPDA
jgi:hypothetical protein